jgi:hypothetical protein
MELVPAANPSEAANLMEIILNIHSILGDTAGDNIH